MALRPLGIGEVVDGAVKLVRLDLRHLGSVAATIFLPVALLQWWDLLDADLTGLTTDTTSAVASILLMGSGLEGWTFPVTVAVALTVLRPFVLHSADEVLFRRRRASNLQVLRGVPGMALASGLKILVIALGTLLAIVPGLLVVARLAVVESAVVSEGSGPFRSIGRSSRLVRGRTFTTLATLSVLFLVRLLLGILLNTAAESGVFLDLEPAATRLLIVTGTYVTAVMVWPVALAAKALIFADLRVRKEALDLDLMIRDLDQESRVPSPTLPGKTARPESEWVWSPPEPG